MQLLKPGNIWGVENPPSDWAMVVASLGGGSKSPTDSSWSGVASGRAETAPKVKSFSKQAAQPAPAKPAFDQIQKSTEESLVRLRDEAEMITRTALAAFDQRLSERMTQSEARFTELTEQSATELAASVQVLKSNILSELIQVSMEEVQARLEGLSRAQEERWTQHAARLESESAERLATKSAEEIHASEAALERWLGGKMRTTEADLATRVSEALQGLEAVINTFRASFADELSAQNEKSLQEAEQALRTRLAAMLSSIMAPGQGMPVASDPALKK
jgi:hypothetical protein